MLLIFIGIVIILATLPAKNILVYVLGCVLGTCSVIAGINTHYPTTITVPAPIFGVGLLPDEPET